MDNGCGKEKGLIGLFKIAGPVEWNCVETGQPGLLLLGQLDCCR